MGMCGLEYTYVCFGTCICPKTHIFGHVYIYIYIYVCVCVCVTVTQQKWHMIIFLFAQYP